jgi:hypothetical protein
MSAHYDQPSAWLGEEKVYGWHVNMPDSGPAFLMRTIATDGMMQSQDYAHRALAIARQLLPDPNKCKLYVNNSSLGLMLYAETSQPVPDSYYAVATAINDALASNP